MSQATKLGRERLIAPRNARALLLRAAPSKPWRWEIYRAGRKSRIECSSDLYVTVEAAKQARKAALKQLLTEFPD